MKKLFLIFFLLIASISEAMLSTTSNMNSRHWLQNSDGTFYAHRKEVTITGSSAGAQTDYQIPVTVYNSTHTISSTIATTTTSNGWAVNYVWQPKLFYEPNVKLLIVFYSNGTSIVYQTSVDGITWSTAIVLKADGVVGHRIGLAFDGTNFHYAYNRSGDGDDTLYRRFTLGATGALTYAAAEQTALAVAPGTSVLYPSIIVDSSGYPYISHVLFTNSYPNTPWSGYITKASTNDGTWTTAAGFPYIYATNYSAKYPTASMAALTDGTVYIAYCRDDTNYIYGRLWNSSWSAEEQITIETTADNQPHLVADGTNIHLVTFYTTPTKLVYRKRIAGFWGTETATEMANITGHHSITLTGPDKLILSYINATSDHVYYTEIINGVIGAEVDWVDESSDTAPSWININGLITSSGYYKTAVVYSTGAGSPYNIKFKGLPRDNGNYIVASDIQADFDDIRIVPNSRLVGTPLSQWEETKTASQKAQGWVKVPSIPDNTGTVKVYVYYGNASATSASSGANTMVFYDGFESDLSAWDISQTTSLASVQSIVKFSGSQALLVDDSVNAEWVQLLKDVGSTEFLKFGYVFRINQPYSSTNDLYDYGIAANKYHQTRINGSTFETSYNGSDFTAISTLVYDVWYKYLASVDSTTSTHYLDGVQKTSGAVLSSVQTSKIVLQFGSILNNKGKYYIDDVYIAKYVSPEPSITAVGSQVFR